MSKSVNRAVLEIDEAMGKRVRRLLLEEPYPNSHQIYLAIEFDDQTEVLIEVNCSPCFEITHLARDAKGELAPVKKPIFGALRSLVKKKKRSSR